MDSIKTGADQHLRDLEEQLRKQPDNVAVRKALAQVYGSLGGAFQDKRLLKQALQLDPVSAEAHHRLGLFFSSKGKVDKARYELELAAHLAAVRGQHVAGLAADLACVYRLQERWELALSTLLKATQMGDFSPDARTLAMTAALLCAKGEVYRASQFARRATQTDPDYAEGFNSLAVIRRDAGEVEEAVQAFRSCLALEPEHLHAHHSLLMSLLYCSDAETAFAEHKLWGERIEARAKQSGLFREAAVLNRRRGGGEKLRVGYVSPDFRGHSVSYFVEHLFRFHDRQAFDLVFLHDSVEKDDGKTALLQSLCAGEGEGEWRKTGHLSETQMLEYVRSLELDILVELAGHSGNNRLHVLGCRVAPVQISYIGYPATTGLPSTVDYRLVDEITDPVESAAASLATETLVRFEQCFLCYTPPQSSLPSASAEQPGCQLCQDERIARASVVFGSFNTLSKLQPAVLAAWQQILQTVPGSVLVLKSKALQSPEVAAKYMQLFPSVICLGMTPDTGSHFHVYQHVDIALDAFPYAGTTTTCEALFNGVPVVTCLGPCHSHNVSASLIAAIGRKIPDLSELLIAADPVDYVARAVALAQDAAKLQFIKQNLRSWMLQSRLCDGERHCRELERIFARLAAPLDL